MTKKLNFNAKEERHAVCLRLHRVREKDLQFSLNKFKRIFTIFDAHYPEDTFY